MLTGLLRKLHLSKCRVDVACFMSPVERALTPNCSLSESLKIFTALQTHILPLVDEKGILMGLIPLWRVVEKLQQGIPADSMIAALPVETAEVCFPFTPLGDLIDLIQRTGAETVVVVSEEGRPVGMVNPRDLIYGAIEQIGHTLNQVIAVLESVYNGILVVDQRGIITCFNRTAERLFRKSAREVIGRHISSLIPSADLQKVLVEGRIYVNKRCQINEHTVVVNHTPVQRDGVIVGAVSCFQDITEFENICEELEHVKLLKTTLETVIENPYEGVIVVDEKGIVTLVNDTYLHILNKKREEVVGRHILDVTPHSLLPQVLKSGETCIGDVWEVNGQEMLVARVPIFRDGRIVGAVKKTLFTDMQLAKLVARKLVKVETELESYKQELKQMYTYRYTLDDLVGETLQELKKMILRAASSRSTVLVTGESGTGKEVVAHAIHAASLRRNGPFIKVNCAAVPENLLESELFGYVGGAFTGAQKGGKPGKFELAHQGTLLLDEIGDMPLTMQAKLLRFLQEREFERLGSNRPIRVDVRIIASTNHDLRALVQAGKFREDLYYRLNVISLEVPPLRERLDDLALLVEALLKRLNAELKTAVQAVSPEVMNVFRNYSWPGNVRELENVLERCLNTVDGHVIQLHHLPSFLRRGLPDNGEPREMRQLNKALAEVERNLIYEAMKAANGNKSMASKALNIPRSVLYRKLRKYGLTM